MRTIAIIIASAIATAGVLVAVSVSASPWEHVGSRTTNGLPLGGGTITGDLVATGVNIDLNSTGKFYSDLDGSANVYMTDGTNGRIVVKRGDTDADVFEWSRAISTSYTDHEMRDNTNLYFGNSDDYGIIYDAVGTDLCIVHTSNGDVLCMDDTDGTVEIITQLQLSAVSSATPAAPVTCDASNFGVLVAVNDTDDTAAAFECICSQDADDSTYDWHLLGGGGTACPAF